MRYLLSILFVFYSLYSYSAITDTTYIDLVDGNDSNDGNSKVTAIKTLGKLQLMIDTMTQGRIVALSDTVYYGAISVKGTDFTSGNPLKFISWNKYSHGRATFNGTKQLTGWSSEGSNVYSKYDTDLPSTEAFSIDYGSIIHSHISFLNGIFINGTWYHNSSTPSFGETPYNVETAAEDDESWFTDTDLSMSTNQYQNAFIYIAGDDYIPDKVKISSNTSNTFYLNTGYWNDGGLYYTYGSFHQKYKIVNDYPNAVGEWQYKYNEHMIYLYHTTNPNNLTIYAPVEDYLFSIVSSSHVILNNIKLSSANMYNFIVDSSHDIDVDSCMFHYSAYSAAQVISSYDVNFKYDTIRYANNNGIFFAYNTDDGDSHVYNCYIDGCGESQTHGDRDFWNYTGITHLYSNSTADFRYNEIANTGDCGMNILNSTGDIVDCEATIIGNYIHDYSLHLNDCGAIHIGGDIDDADKPKIVRKNFIYNVGTKLEWSWRGYMVRGAVYPDGNTGNWLVDSNTIYNAEMIINQWDSHDNTFRENHIVKTNPDNGYDGYQGGLLKFGAGDTHVDVLTFKKNTVVITDDDESGAIVWTNDGSPNTNSIVDSNWYFNPFRYVDQKINKGRYETTTFYTLAEWYSFIGFDQHSTFNQNNWDWSDVSGITGDQFTWLFSNWSGSTHQFNLGNCTLKDTAGTNVITSVKVPAYSSKVLFYVSGNIFTIDKPFYSGPGL